MSRDLASAAVDLFLGSACVGCARPGSVLCLGCATSLEALPVVAWPRPAPAGLPTPYAVTTYDGVARAAILAHKERHVLALAKPLGQALALSVLSVLARGDPVRGDSRPVGLAWPPSTTAQVRDRGHDPMQRIVHQARLALARAGIAVDARQVLERAREVHDQAGLTAGERSANLDGAFRVRRRAGAMLVDRRLVVVDDVLTTGATAIEVTRAARAGGADVIGVAVVAATARDARARGEGAD